MNPHKLPISSEQVKEVERLFHLDICQGCIAKIVGVCAATVSHYLHKLELIHNKRCKHSRSKYKDYKWTDRFVHYKQAGVYLIYNTISQLSYIGSSGNLHQRLYAHYSRMCNGSHENSKMLADCHTYGIDSFHCTIVSLCDNDIDATNIEYKMLSDAKLETLYNQINKNVEYIITDRLTQRLHDHTTVQENGCWSCKYHMYHGYALIQKKLYGKEVPKRTKIPQNINIYAHKYAYLLHNGSIPPGFVVGHTCNNKICVNPDHLEAITISKNIKDHRDSYDKIS